MKLHVLTAVFAIASLASAALPAAGASLAKQDADYLTGAMQRALGRYAMAAVVSKNGSGSVKMLAKSVAQQASKDTRELDALAKKYGVTKPSKLSIFDQYHYAQLQGLKGSALNNRFTMYLSEDDQSAQTAAKSEMSSTNNAQLKAYAKRTYTVLQHELAQLKRT